MASQIQVGKLGSPSSILKPTDIDIQNGFYINSYTLIKADDAYEKQHENETWICLVNAVELGIKKDGKIAYTKTHREFWIRKNDLKEKA